MGAHRKGCLFLFLLLAAGTARGQDLGDAAGTPAAERRSTGNGEDAEAAAEPAEVAPLPEADAHAEPELPPGLPEREALAGDLGGIRSELEAVGLFFEGSLTMDLVRVVDGGVRRGESLQSLFDLNATLDLETFAGLEGGLVFADAYVKRGSFASSDVGDWQSTSNIECDRVEQIAELWWEQTLFDGLVRAKLGKVDGFGEFSVVDNSAEFLNNGMTYSPTLFALPTYPDPSTSVNLHVHPNDRAWIGAGVYDGAAQEGFTTGSLGPKTFFGDPGDLFLVAEAGGSWECGDAALAGKAAVGAWRHTGTFPRFAGGSEKGTDGFYFLVDQSLWRENPDAADDTQGIAAFLLAGEADGDVTEVDAHVAAGFQWTGPIDGRDDEVLGLGASWIRFTDVPAAGFADGFEVAVEAFYKLLLTPAVSVKPDLQWIVNPAGDPAVDHVLVATARLEVLL